MELEVKKVWNILKDDVSFSFLCHVQVHASVSWGRPPCHHACGVDHFEAG